MGLVSTILATASMAQATLFDGAGLRLACLQGECLDTTRVQVLRLQRNQPPGAEFNSQIGAMAAVLIDAAQIADEPFVDQIAQALLYLAGLTSDAAQKNSLLVLANAVLEGSTDLFNLNQPFAASPN